MHDKKALRKIFHQKRTQITEEQSVQWSRDIRQRFFELVRQTTGDGVLFLFAPLAGEPDLLTDIHLLRRHVALPRLIKPGHMNFYLWHPGEALDRGPFQLRQPFALGEPVTPHQGDLIVVPALALDKEGRRLGYGGGFYDRFMEKYASTFEKIIGVSFSPGLSDEPLPVDPWDLQVDLMISDKLSKILTPPSS